MKKIYKSNAEKQKAYRDRQKADGSKVEIRVTVSKDTLDTFKRIIRRNSRTLAEELTYVARKREAQIINRMSDEVKLEYFADLTE